MHIEVMVEKMNRLSLGENDRVLSNLAIFVNRPAGYPAGAAGIASSFYPGSYSYVLVYLLQRFWLVCGKVDFRS
jgi:hypothetical protein